MCVCYIFSFRALLPFWDCDFAIATAIYLPKSLRKYECLNLGGNFLDSWWRLIRRTPVLGSRSQIFLHRCVDYFFWLSIFSLSVDEHLWRCLFTMWNALRAWLNSGHWLQVLRSKDVIAKPNWICVLSLGLRANSDKTVQQRSIRSRVVFELRKYRVLVIAYE